MNRVFVWTLHDIVGLVALGLVLTVLLGVFAYAVFQDLRAKWRKRK